jgi:beta-lactamase regulating signal transducer with metallopeptidase domain
MPFISHSNFLQALGWAVINSLWQMALLWMIYKFFVFIIKPGSSLKSKSAFILLIGGTGWFIISFILAYNTPVKNNSTLLTWNDISYSLNDRISSILPYASIAYLVLLVVPVIRFVISLRQVIQIRTKNIRKIEIQWRLFVKKMTAYLDIRRPVQVWISENITSPVTVGFLKPVILVPLAAVNQLTTYQMEAVLLHELAHIKRFDYLLNVITVIIRTIFYFNPFTRSLADNIDAEREKSCDEWVLQYQYDAYAYSSALLALEQMKKNSLQLALAAVTTKKELLLERIKKIMGLPSAPVYSVKNSFRLLTGIVGPALLFFALFANAFKSGSNTVTRESSPLSFLQTNNNPDINFATVNNKHLNKIANYKPVSNQHLNKFDIGTDDYEFHPYDVNNYMMPVNFIRNEVTPELDKEEEQQVQEVMEASKKILEDRNWKKVKSSVADAMTEAEKQSLKKLYAKELSKLDWKELEDKLRASYDQINWNNVNAKMNREIVNIKIDSLTNVYNFALTNVIKAKQELQKECLKGIPDTDITIAGLDSAKKTLDKTLTELKAVKQKKIIRL